MAGLLIPLKIGGKYRRENSREQITELYDEVVRGVEVKGK